MGCSGGRRAGERASAERAGQQQVVPALSLWRWLRVSTASLSMVPDSASLPRDTCRAVCLLMRGETRTATSPRLLRQRMRAEHQPWAGLCAGR